MEFRVNRLVLGMVLLSRSLLLWRKGEGGQFELSETVQYIPDGDFSTVWSGTF
jgi:hypothetical protein